MTKIFLDTNIWLRYLVGDNLQAKECAELIKFVEMGVLTPYTSTVVLLETAYTLKSYYRLKSFQITKILEKILKTRGLTLIEKTSFRKSLNIHKKTKIKLPDCLIATQIPSRTTLVTYDNDFTKIPKLNPQTPKQVLENLGDK